ncbi:MAG: hypothetical protein V1753_04460, partial [Pseudomonadota bacterium]
LDILNPDSSVRELYSISGNVDWQLKKLHVNQGDIIQWRYYKDGAVTHGSDKGWIDDVYITPYDTSGTAPEGWSENFESGNIDHTFRTDGQADWAIDSVIHRDSGNYSIYSGEVADNEESIIQHTVETAGTLTFYWKVSSEQNYDYLEFDILNPDSSVRESYSISGNVDWQLQTHHVYEGDIIQWRYYKDGAITRGSDKGWIDDIVFTPGDSSDVTDPYSSASTGSLSAWSEDFENSAIDTPWRTGGQADWAIATDAAYAGTHSAGSGNVANNKHSVIQRTIATAGTLTFYWKVSNEYSGGYLEFAILNPDSSVRESYNISGNVDWRFQTHHVNAQDVFQWRYRKNDSKTHGSDKGWIDNIVFTPDNPAGYYDDFENGNIDSWTTSGQAGWGSTTDTAHSGIHSASSGAIANNQESVIQCSVEISGTLTFYWKVSSESSYDFLEFYINGVRQSNRISGNVDWQLQTYHVDTGDIIKWRYYKDHSISRGSDKGWIDDVSIEP